MKLIISGATGYVGSELLRQSLARDDIHTVVALARKPVTAPGGVGSEKLRSIMVPDYPVTAAEYSDEARREFAGADACIWYAFLSLYPRFLSNCPNVSSTSI